MTLRDVTKLIKALIKQHRVIFGVEDKSPALNWQDISMTVEEAQFVIEQLEAEKGRYQRRINLGHSGAEVAALATSGVGCVIMVTGLTLMLFPPTSITGAITLVSGAGATGTGIFVGDSVRAMSVRVNMQAMRQIDGHISSIRQAVLDALEQEQRV